MTPDRWRQIEALYQTAQNCGTAERVALLENADPEIRSLVQRMLRESSGSQLLNWPLADLLGNADKTTIAPGAQLGPYRIQAQIGAGGMGTVFRAIDTRLDRIVAIKIAAERYSERFQIEARVISTLNHPHICTLHDVGPDYLVMEFIEGTTLTEEIAKGPMAQDRVARFGSQMASALAEAHAHDIIHRDLKPGNVMVTRHGVKVLDFGLAKIFSHSGITETNAIMGTPAYMPPEQMQGRECDARTDIYALGLVLAEMATGKRTTPGGRPQLDSLPEKLGHVVERCVGENPDDRWQNAREVKAELEWAAKAAPAAAVEVRGSRWRRALLWALAGAATTGLALFAWFHTSDRKTVRAVPMRLQILTPANPRLQLTGLFALSPDGQRLALVASGANGVPSIWIRDLNSLEIRPLPGTEGVSTLLFWSPDSQFVAFDSGGKLLKIDVSGGAAQTVCGLDADGLGGSWNKDDVIVFGVFGKPIMRVSAAGGAATPLTVLDPSHGDVAHTVPWFLPDGKHFLYLRDNGINGAISVGSLDSKPEEQDSRRLFETASGAAYVPSSDPYSGMLVFLRGQTLMAQSFDARRLSLSGEPVRVTEDPIGVFLDYSLFSVSANGTLAYSSAGNDNQLTWFDAQGRILNTVGEPGPYVGVSVSPDGTRAFAYKRTIVPDRHIALWLLDLSRGTSTRSDLDPSTDNMDAVWASDGRSIIFGSDRVGQMKDIYEKPVSGVTNAEALLRSNEWKSPLSWSPDGRFLLYSTEGGKTKSDLWVLPLRDRQKPVPFLRTEFNEADGRFSPDGRWVAYTSDESGRNEVYVRAFTPGAPGETIAGDKFLISSGGGYSPLWREAGKDLYYLGNDRKVMAVTVSKGAVFQASVPRVLFQAPPRSPDEFGQTQWAPSPDGSRFLFLVPESRGEAPFTVLLNWQAGLKR